MAERKIYTAQLKHAALLSDQTRHLEFAVEGQERFEFAPGQFLSLLASKEGHEITRAYSIASAPYKDPQFDLCLNRVDDGFFSNNVVRMRKRLVLLVATMFVAGACMENTTASKACEYSGSGSECKACCKRNGANGFTFRERQTKKMCLCTM